MDWLLASDEPWTSYRALVDLEDVRLHDPRAQSVRAAMMSHPQVGALLADVGSWPWPGLRRHNDATHPLHKLSVLADFGLRWDDPGLGAVVEAALAHQSEQGAFQTLVEIPRAFGGNDQQMWTWLPCDAPVMLYCLLALGKGDDPRVKVAVRRLSEQVADNGWQCRPDPALGKFRGPGRKDDPCPIANVYALKALSLVPELSESASVRAGIEMLLWHWEHQRERKLYLFGIGTDFRKLKYPLVWYDILHVLDVLSRFPIARRDPRYAQMFAALMDQADDAGRFTAGSMYLAWRGWSFADKKHPSPWLTLAAARIARRTVESA